MMYHPSGWKRSAAGVAAIRAAEATGGAMVVTLFGTCPKPAGLPLHWKYRENPPQAELAELFGSSEIFLSPSEVEGFALPPCEAMLAGCACVLTDIGGHRDAGVPDETALMPPLGDDHAMVNAIMRLRRDPLLCARLGEAGVARARSFQWDAVTERFIGALDFHS
jgi:glycosyltransferase involved in cell wall biosynthesis